MKRSLSATLLLLLGLILSAACAEIRPVPATLDPQAYTPITYEQLRDPARANLQAHQKVKVDAYFWEFLTYDPAMVRHWLALARHPRSWSKLQWFALYGEEDMKGYYDRAALDAAQRPRYPLNRLDHITVYGELDSLGYGYYLHVHHIERIVED
jgi:hypothetical protein